MKAKVKGHSRGKKGKAKTPVKAHTKKTKKGKKKILYTNENGNIIGSLSKKDMLKKSC